MDKIFIKLGWPGALIILVGFLGLAIYLVVDRAVVENALIEEEIELENSTSDNIELAAQTNENSGIKLFSIPT